MLSTWNRRFIFMFFLCDFAALREASILLKVKPFCEYCKLCCKQQMSVYLYVGQQDPLAGNGNSRPVSGVQQAANRATHFSCARHIHLVLNNKTDPSTGRKVTSIVQSQSLNVKTNSFSARPDKILGKGQESLLALQHLFL